jgi:hypothetical protein
MTGEVQVGSKREILTPSTYFPLRLGQRTCGAYTAMTVSCQPGGALRLGSRYGSSAIDPLRCAITSSCRAFRNIVSRSFPSGVDLARSVRRSTSCANRCPKLDNASSLRSIACPHRRMFRNTCVKVQLSVSVFHVLFRAEMVRHIDLNQTMPLRPKMGQGATGHECGSIRTCASWPARSVAKGRHAPLHSITSSAVASSDGGISRPSIFAVLRLTMSSYLVGS